MTLRFLVLGDSLAFGTGSDRAADTLGARLTRSLEAAGHEVRLDVVAVPGATSLDLAAQVRRAAPLRAELALLVIGANDLTRLVAPASAATALGAALRELQSGGTSVLVVPTPDLSSVASVPPAFRPFLAGICNQVRHRQIAVAEAAGAVVAPVARTLSAAFAADPALFSADRYHPSSAGYALIADSLAPHLLELAGRVADAAA
ncbi:MAG: Lipolytic Esterase [Modestobacter sp.]|nr:Lipolytic Esterase [Modestobacter sp.]